MKMKKMPLSVLLVGLVALLVAGCSKSPKIQEIPTKETYGYVNPDESKAVAAAILETQAMPTGSVRMEVVKLAENRIRYPPPPYRGQPCPSASWWCRWYIPFRRGHPA